MDSQQEMRQRMAEAGKSFFRYVKGDYKDSMQAIWDDRAGSMTTYLPRIHEPLCKNVALDHLRALEKGMAPVNCH